MSCVDIERSNEAERAALLERYKIRFTLEYQTRLSVNHLSELITMYNSMFIFLEKNLPKSSKM